MTRSIVPPATLALLAGLTFSWLSACSSTSPAVTVSPSSVPSAGTVSFKTDIAPLLVNSCAQCHTPTGLGARSAVFIDADKTANYTEVSAKLTEIISQTQSGKMPQGGPPLTATQLGLLLSWQTDGAPNN